MRDKVRHLDKKSVHDIIICVAKFFWVRGFSVVSAPSLHILLYLFMGKRSDQLTLPGWGSCADLVRNRGVLCSWCNLFKSDVGTSYQRNLQHRVVLTKKKLSRVDEVKDPLSAVRSRMGRLGEPIEMAKLMAFMVSDDNAYMSGSEIVSDGGLGAIPEATLPASTLLDTQ